MKRYLLVPFCAAVAFPLAVTAEPSVEAATLAELEAIVARCSQVDPANSAKYKELLARVFSDVPVADIEAARNTEIYLHAYEASSARLAQATKDEVVVACAEALSSNN
jgi:hypothetical protein